METLFIAEKLMFPGLLSALWESSAGSVMSRKGARQTLGSSGPGKGAWQRRAE